MPEEALYIDLSEQALAALDRAVFVPFVDAATRIVRNEIVQQIDPGPPRTGRQYRIPGTTALYTASAPGQPHANREGLTRESWDVIPPVVTSDGVVGFVANGRRVGNGRWLLALLLERGTGEIAPRPTIRPGIEAARPKIQALINRLSA